MVPGSEDQLIEYLLLSGLTGPVIPKGETQHQFFSGIQTHIQPHGKVLQPRNGLWLDIWYVKYDHYDSKIFDEAMRWGILIVAAAEE